MTLALLGVGVAVATSLARADEPTITTRLGIYDSRAVGLAYGRSSIVQKEFADLHAKHKQAKDAGDEATVKQLEAQGQARQLRLHLQVFSVAPVPEAIEAVRKDLPDLAQRVHVVAITSTSEYHAAGVEIVDVTDELVKLFNPTPETLKVIAEAKTTKPLPIEEVARIPADE
jgi:hypothetical protein